MSVQNVAATRFANLVSDINIPQDGILSRTIYSDDQVKVVLFGLDKGQELSEHSAAMPAIVQVLQGEAMIGLGSETFAAGPGSWLHMAARQVHSVHALEPLVMLLTLLK